MPDVEAVYRALLAKAYDEVLAATELVDGDEAPRLLAYRAQALRAMGRPREGLGLLIQAIRITKAKGDTASTTTLRALHADLARSAAALDEAERARQADAHLRHATPDGLDSDTLVRKAQTHLDAGDAPGAIVAAQLAVARAHSPRDAVLAHLALARATGGAEHVHAAHAVADDSNDPNLVTAVAHAARALRVALRPPTFG